MSIVKQILAGAAAATIATGSNAGDQKQLPPFEKPLPQEAVQFDSAFNDALKALVTTINAKQKPTERLNQELVASAYKSIRQQQKKAPGKDQEVIFYDYRISSVVVVDAGKKTIAVFHGTEDVMKGRMDVTDKKPVHIYSADPAIKEADVVANALEAIEKSNQLMALRMAKGTPNFGNALQPGDQGKLDPVKTR